MAVEPTTGAETARLSEARERYVAAGVATSGLFVEHAHGATIVDVDGREYIDFVGGIGVLNGGHTPEPVVAAIREQAERYLHQCFSVAMYEPYVEVCRRICELHPGTFATKALLQNSGAEAVENAVKIARYATGRDAIVCFDQAFHGRTLLTMTLTSKVMPYKKGFGPFAPEVYRAAAPWPYRGIGTDEALASVRKLFKSQVDPHSRRRDHLRARAGRGRLPSGDPGFLRRAPGDLPRVRDRLHRRRGAVRHGPHRRGSRASTTSTASSPISSSGASRSAAACRSPASRVAPS